MGSNNSVIGLEDSRLSTSDVIQSRWSAWYFASSFLVLFSLFSNLIKVSGFFLSLIDCWTIGGSDYVGSISSSGSSSKDLTLVLVSINWNSIDVSEELNILKGSSSCTYSSSNAKVLEGPGIP